jgi:hypothetical protein
VLDGVVLDVDRHGGASVAADVAARLPPPLADGHVKLQSPVELGPYSRLARRRRDPATCPWRRLDRGPWHWGVVTAWAVDLGRDEIRLLRRTSPEGGFVLERRRAADLLVTN